MAGERPLRIDRGGYGIARAGERDEERVALRVHLAAAVRGEGCPQQAAVLGEQVTVGVTRLLQQVRGPLDVREEEGDRAGRQRRLDRPVGPRLDARTGHGALPGALGAGRPAGPCARG
jgi:hypothetical protein